MRRDFGPEDAREFWSDSTPSMLRAITERIFVAVREADNGIKESWGSSAGRCRASAGR